MGDTIRWTPEQERVITERGKNILVSAAAGSGKTAVLAERVVSMCTGENRTDIDRILVLTFTRAAAGEMKDRIRKRFDELLSEDPCDKNLERQLTLMSNAKITTIDSFCVYLFRNYFEDAGLDPSLRLIDEKEAAIISEKVMKELLAEKTEENSEAFRALLSYYSKKDKNDDLASAVLEVNRLLSSAAWPDRFLDMMERIYEEDGKAQREELLSFMMKYSSGILSNAVQEFDSALQLIADPAADSWYSFLSAEKEALLPALAQTSPDGRREALLSFAGRNARLPSGKGREKTPFDDEIKAKRSAAKDAVSDLLKGLFRNSMAEADEVFFKAAPFAKELISLSREFYHRFLKEKETAGVMDFSDCEHYALSILIDEKTGERREAAKELSSFFSEIMVDEYQDSNELQETILKSLSTESDEIGDYFMVGDMKQSIYGFRNADPAIFAEKYGSFHTADEEKNARDRLILLDRNFRSRQAVIDAVNDIFVNVMQEDVGGIGYGEKEKLSPGADFSEAPDTDENKTEIDVITFDGESGGKGSYEDPLEPEARLALSIVKKLVGSFIVTDKKTGQKRKAVYGDITILSRSTAKTFSTLKKVFDEGDVSLVMEERENYLLSREVRTMLSLLSLIDNPRDDIALASVLKSPIANVPDSTLLAVRTEFPDGHFFDAFLKYSAAHPEEEKLSAFSEFLRSLRKKADVLPIHELIADIYEKTDFVNYCSALPGGGIRKDNLRKLFDLAVSFEKNSFRGLFRFLKYVEKQKAYRNDSGKGSSGNFPDEVSFCTIHKSKGLEYPIVILYAAGRKFESISGKYRMLSDRRHGLFLEAADVKRRVFEKPLYLDVARLFMTAGEKGEYLRLLYVAMTRAREKLIITGTLSGDEALQKWESIELPFTFVKRFSASSFLDYLMPCALKNKELFSVNVIPDSCLEESYKAAESAEEKDNAERLSDIVQKPLPIELRKKYDELLERTAFVYPYAKDAGHKEKYSVTELKGQSPESREFLSEGGMLFEPEEESEKTVPLFMGGERNTARGSLRGSAVHRFLECFDLSRADHSSAFAAEKQRMRENGLISSEEEGFIDQERSVIEAFLKSPVAQRMHEAALRKELFREKAFVMESSFAEIFEDTEEGAESPILVQGIIDAFFFENDSIVIVDYKTDRKVTAAELEKRYSLQLKLYGRALEKTYGMKASERIVYSLSLKKEIRI